MRSVPDPPESLPSEHAEVLRELPPELTPEEQSEVLRELFPGSPEDLERRFCQLRDLLRHQPEFAARFPEAYEILFPKHTKKRGHVGLLLPSFGIRVLPSDPGEQCVPQDKLFGGDAYSYTASHRAVLPAAMAALQGVLLAVLGREEYADRIQPHPLAATPYSDLFEGVEVPQESPIRITDLRLASHLDPEALKRGLGPLLDQLKKPFTPKDVADWKHHLLGEALEDVNVQAGAERKPCWAQTALLKQHFGDEGMGIAAVSFAAAALWLFLDLGQPGVEDAPHFRLAQDIVSVADSVRNLRKGLYREAGKLEALAARRPAGHQPYPYNDYRALCDYREGEPLEEIAEKLGIAAYESENDDLVGIIPYHRESECLRLTPEKCEELVRTVTDERQKRRKNKNWRAELRRHLANGENFEAEHYPRAAGIFAHKDNPHVERKARLVADRFGDKGSINWHGLCAAIRVGSPGTARGREVAEAYLSLGIAVKKSRAELP